jgi:hypothetical protein
MTSRWSPDLEAFKILYDSPTAKQHFAKVSHELLHDCGQARRPVTPAGTSVYVDTLLSCRDAKLLLHKLETYAFGAPAKKRGPLGFFGAQQSTSPTQKVITLQTRLAELSAATRRALQQRRWQDAVEYQRVTESLHLEMRRADEP